PGDPSLEMNQDRHDDKRERGDDDSDSARGWCLSVDKCFDRVDGAIDRQGYEAQTDNPKRPPPTAPAPALTPASPHPPPASGPARDLDGRVKTETDQGNASGDDPGADRNDAFRRIPRDCQILKSASVARHGAPLLIGADLHRHVL